MSKLAERGWRLGLRFDPLIYSEDYRRQYRELYDQVLAAVDGTEIFYPCEVAG